MKKTTLDKKQVFLSRVIMGAAMLLLGAFLLCAAIFNLNFKHALIISCLAIIGLTMLILAFVQENSVSLWLSVILLTAGLVSLLACLTALKYSQLYPLYILAPALASFITALYSGLWHDHLKIIAVFAPTSFIFMFNSILDVSWKIVMPLFIIVLGAAIIITTVLTKERK